MLPSGGGMVSNNKFMGLMIIRKYQQGVRWEIRDE